MQIAVHLLYYTHNSRTVLILQCSISSTGIIWAGCVALVMALSVIIHANVNVSMLKLLAWL